MDWKILKYKIKKWNHIWMIMVMSFLLFTGYEVMAQADAGDDKAVCVGSATGVLIGGSGCVGCCYSWQPTTDLSDPKVLNPTAKPSSTTTYTLTVTGPDFSFKDTDDMKVDVVNTLTLTYDENPDTYLPLENDIIQVTATVSPAISGTAEIEFELTQADEFTFSDGSTGTKTVSFTGSTATVDIKSTTYWGVVKVKATLEGMPCEDEKQLPTDTDSDGIADSWETTLGRANNWDEETTTGNTNNGDGFSKLDEYKGVKVDGTYTRLKTDKKEVFMNTSASGQGGFARSGYTGELGLEVPLFAASLNFYGSYSPTGVVITDLGVKSANNNGIVVVNGVYTGNNSILLGEASGVRNGSSTCNIYATTMSNIFSANSIPEDTTLTFNITVPTTTGTATYQAVFNNTDLNGDGDTTDLINPFDLLAPVIVPANNDAIDATVASMTILNVQQRTTRHEAGHGVGIASSVNGFSHPTTGNSVMRSFIGPAKVNSFTATDIGQMKLK